MGTTTNSIAQILNSLVETCKDGQEGFRCAADDVTNVEVKNLFMELSRERGRFAEDLQRMVATLGEEAEETGSTFGLLHRGWINLISALSSESEFAILGECERGEGSAVEEYHDALAHEELPSSVREVVQRQCIAVIEAHDRIRDLRNSYEL